MSAEQEPDLKLEIAHILLLDIVGYSRLLVNEQVEDSVATLRAIVRAERVRRTRMSFDSAYHSTTRTPLPKLPG